MNATCSPVSSTGYLTRFSSSFSHRSYLLAILCLMRMFWIVGELLETPPSLSWLDSAHAPGRMGQAHLQDLRGQPLGVVMGWDFGMGGRSLSPSRSCVWKRRLNS